jgi:hypothetical protein
LTAVVAAGWGCPREELSGAGFDGGAVLAGRGRAWALVEDPSAFGLGAALAWADRHRSAGGPLAVIAAAAPAATLARRACSFTRPIETFALTGRSLARAAPAPMPVRPPLLVPNTVAETFRAAAEAAGAAVVEVDGTLAAEVRGLEVGRLVLDEAGWRLAVGVGAVDRAGHAALGEAQDVATLRRVAGLVETHRVAGAPPHPANRLAPERWLRAVLCERPDLLGARRLEAVTHPVLTERRGWRGVAGAVGEDGDGAPLVCAASVGVDLELVPEAADLRVAVEPAARLVLALPVGDALGVTHTLAASLGAPAVVRQVPTGWRALAGGA